MTKDDLDEIRKRCEAATPDLRVYYEPPGDYGGGNTWHVENERGQCFACDVSKENAALFAHARTDISALLEEVERLQRRTKELDRENWELAELVAAHAIRRLPAMIEEYRSGVLQPDRDELRGADTTITAMRRLVQRLALLEPVWEAAKVVHEIRQRMNALDDLHYDALDNEFGDAVAAMGHAIDAAVAKEGK